MKYLLMYILPVFLCLASCAESKDLTVNSPDGSIHLQVGEENGRIYYTVNKQKQQVLDKSFLGFELQSGRLDQNLKIKDIKHSKFHETWDQVWGEEITVDNTYNQLSVDVEESDGLKRQFSIVFRIFNDGIGFRYVFPEQENLKDFVIMD